MAGCQSKLRFHMSAGQSRRGATFVEYIVVVILVSFGVFGSLYFFTACEQEYQVVADRLNDIQNVSIGIENDRSDSKSVEEVNDEALIADNLDHPIDYRAFAVFMFASLCVVGVLYARLAFKRHYEKEEAGVLQRGGAVNLPPKHSAALENVFRQRNNMRRQLGDTWDSFVDGCGTAGDFMSTGLFTIAPETTISEAKVLLKEKGFRRVLVVKKNGQLAGIVSKKDLTKKESGDVSQVMTSEPIVVEPEMRISLALSILLKQRISCIPIVKDGYLIGLLSTSDLMVLLQCVLVNLEKKHEDEHSVLEKLVSNSRMETSQKLQATS